MEEYIGNLWDRFIARLAYRGYPEAAVGLEEMAGGLLPPFFRALEGDPGLSVKPASAIAHGARRRLLQAIAGSFKKVEALPLRSLPARLKTMAAARKLAVRAAL